MQPVLFAQRSIEQGLFRRPIRKGRAERKKKETMADETSTVAATPRASEGAATERPAGDRPAGDRPERPAGDRPDRPAGDRPERPAGDRPGGRGPGGRGPGGPGGSGPGGRKFFRRKKVCKFCVEKIDSIHYRDVRLLQQFVAERGKIVPRRLTGVCTTHQRRLTRAIKQARNIALLPFAARY
jgi:small subunit ribosomal protein S18